MIKFFPLGILAAFVFFSCADQVIPLKKINPAPALKVGKITSISIGNLFAAKQSGQVFLIDCRKSLFYRLGSISGSVNLSLNGFKKDNSEMKKHLSAAIVAQKIIVLYCQNQKCPDAYIVAKKMAEKGYDVSIYEGGWEEWKSSGLE